MPLIIGTREYIYEQPHGERSSFHHILVSDMGDEKQNHAAAREAASVYAGPHGRLYVEVIEKE